MERVLKCAVALGEQMLICGGEIHRVEDSMRRICLACGAKRADLFIITSAIMATLTDAEGSTQTQIREIYGISPDIQKLHNLNALSRKICSDGSIPEDFENQLEGIVNAKKYPGWIQCLGNAIMAASFTLFFGGIFKDAFLALIAGTAIYFTTFFAERMHLNNIFSKFLSSMTAALLAFAAYKLGIAAQVDKIMIGCIMVLIPGTGLTNALRDLFVGDSIAGMLRTTDAMLSALAIAAGYFVVAFVFGGAM